MIELQPMHTSADSNSTDLEAQNGENDQHEDHHPFIAQHSRSHTAPSTKHDKLTAEMECWRDIAYIIGGFAIWVMAGAVFGGISYLIYIAVKGDWQDDYISKSDAVFRTLVLGLAEVSFLLLICIVVLTVLEWWTGRGAESSAEA